MKVYLAGPDVFRKDALKYLDELKEKLKKYGHEGISPFDKQVDASLSPPDQGEQIYQNNKQIIDSCDAVLANISPFRGPSCDAGTAWEIGYAVAKNKPVFAYLQEDDSFLPFSSYSYRCNMMEDAGLKIRTEAFPVIENFGLTDNLMITCSVNYVGACALQAITRLVRYFTDRQESATRLD